MSGWTLISQAFGEGVNLYTDVLGLPSHCLTDNGSTITSSQLRKAYYKRALEFHPDKQSSSLPQDVETAKLKFQAISLAYTILSDPQKKREYDEAGDVWDEDEMGPSSSSDQGFDMWSEYFRGIFGVVTTKDIDAFTLQYKCSEEEHKDVLKYYTKFKGNLNKMLECVMCSSEVDKKRWVDDYIIPAVKDGSVDDYMDEIHKTLRVVHQDNDGNMEEDEDDFDEEMTETDEDDQAQKNTKQTNDVAMGRKSATKTVTKKKGPAKNVKTKRSEQRSGHVAPTDLIAAIQNKSKARREEAFGQLMSGIEAKYGGASGKNSKGNEIPDDEFEAIRSRLDANRKGGSQKRR